MNLGIYCETLSPALLDDPGILDLLGSHEVTLACAVRFAEEDGCFDPGRIASYLELGEKLKERGGRMALWPLLPKSKGYWINEKNLGYASRMADALCEGCRRFGAKPDLVIADVETPWPQMESVFLPVGPAALKPFSAVKMYLQNRSPRRFSWAVKRLSEIVSRLRAEIAPVSAATFGLLVADLVQNGHMLQDFLEMPIFPVQFDAYNVMFYNSYLPHAVPFIMPPPSAPRALYEYMSECVSRFSQKAWVTLGSTWEGVIPGNEGKSYTHPSQLEADAAAAKAAGVENIWLYCLEGVLYSDQKLTQRRSIEESDAFFKVLLETPAKEPAPHPAWARGRKVLEFAVTDRLKRFYKP